MGGQVKDKNEKITDNLDHIIGSSRLQQAGGTGMERDPHRHFQLAAGRQYDKHGRYYNADKSACRAYIGEDEPGSEFHTVRPEQGSEF